MTLRRLACLVTAPVACAVTACNHPGLYHDEEVETDGSANTVTQTVVHNDPTPVTDSFKGGIQLPIDWGVTNIVAVDDMGNPIGVFPDPGVVFELDTVVPPPDGRQWLGFSSSTFTVDTGDTISLQFDVVPPCPQQRGKALLASTFASSTFGNRHEQWVNVGTDTSYIGPTDVTPVFDSGVIVSVNPDSISGTVQKDSDGSTIPFFDCTFPTAGLGAGSQVAFDVLTDAPGSGGRSRGLVEEAANLRGSGTVSVDEYPGGAPQIGHRVAPNPFRVSTRFELMLPEDSPVRIQIFDVTGRAVRALVAGGRHGGGPVSLEWDGKADRGGRVPAGTYFYSVRTTSGHAVGKVSTTR